MREELARFREYIYDSSVSLKDRSFMVFSVMVLGALFAAVPCGMLVDEPISSTISSLIGALVFLVFVIYAYKKKKIAQAKIVICIVLIFFFLPAMFFTNGGVYSGTPVWLLMGTVYIVLILEGKLKLFMFIAESVILIVCWIIGYLYPDTITTFSRKGSYLDSIVAVLLVGVVIYVLLTFQHKLYDRENELARKKTEEVEELNRSQSRFFSSMSHEIRTPINTVLGLNEIILRQEDASEEIKKDARNIQGAGKMLLALINDILDFSKIEAGRMDIIPVEYSVANLVSEMVNMIWMKAEQKGLEFKVDIDPDIPEALYGDEVRIKQILINMLNNAVKYTQSGSVRFHMESEQLDEDNIILTITISDTGMGIIPEAIPHLFDAFIRVDEENNRFIEGTGLGLSIVKQLVDLMHGEITVSSVYTKGSAFTVTLPQKTASARRIGNLEISEGASASSTRKFEHSFFAPDARILIVDDNEMNLEVESKLLEGTEMVIDLAGSGRDALELTLSRKYDAIFMDHIMPEMDGIACYEEIRSQKGGLNKTTPIVVLTANAGSENKTLYKETGFNAYLVKPVSGVQLEEIMISLLPEEKIRRNENVELSGGTMNTASGYSRKKPVCITTCSMSDLPESVVREQQIGVIPFSIKTDNGLFWDGEEAVGDELIRYINEGGDTALSEAPTVEEFMKFFADQLQKAHHLIHITVTSGMGEEYNRAVQAARAFDNVTIVDSQMLSTSTGMLVLIACRLADQGLSVEKIVEELETARKRIHCSFVVANTDFLTKRGFMSQRMNRTFKSLWIRPILKMKNNKASVDRLVMGNLRQCYEVYIKRALPKKVNPDRDILFITYADVSEENLLWIEDIIKKRASFDRIVIKKASAAISANCGPGTVGIQYMDEGDTHYNLSRFLPEEEVYDDDQDIEEIEDTLETLEDTLETLEDILGDSSELVSPWISGDSAMAAEPVEEEEEKWYDSIEGLDLKTALKNSGSEATFKKILEIFYESADQKKDEIVGFYNSEDWENYTVKVHALKSSARLIGAMELSEEAAGLEAAGKSSDITYIRNNNDRVMEIFEDVRDKLDGLFRDSKEMEDARPVAEDFIMDGFFDMVKEAVDEMDYNKVEEAFRELEDYAIPEKDREVFDKIKASFDIIDYDGMNRALEERL